MHFILIVLVFFTQLDSPDAVFSFRFADQASCEKWRHDKTLKPQHPENLRTDMYCVPETRVFRTLDAREADYIMKSGK